jgi:hypothetical protein
VDSDNEDADGDNKVEIKVEKTGDGAATVVVAADENRKGASLPRTMDINFNASLPSNVVKSKPVEAAMRAMTSGTKLPVSSAPVLLEKQPVVKPKVIKPVNVVAMAPPAAAVPKINKLGRPPKLKLYGRVEHAKQAQKAMTAIRGAWSPARPASRKPDPQDEAEAFLSPKKKRKSSADDNAGGAGKKAKSNASKAVSKRAAPKKSSADDDDPLASLAAAALGHMAPSGSNVKRGVGRPRKSTAAVKTKDTATPSRATATTTTASRVKSSAVAPTPESPGGHPAFSVPVVKGARTARARLNGVDRNMISTIVDEQIKEQLKELNSKYVKVDIDDRRLHATITKAVERKLLETERDAVAIVSGVVSSDRIRSRLAAAMANTTSTSTS